MIGINRLLCGLAMVLASSTASLAQTADIFGIIPFNNKNYDRLEVRGAVMSYETGVFTSNRRSGVTLHGEIAFPSPEVLSVLLHPRPYIGFNVSPGKNHTDYLFAGLGWENYLTDKFYLIGSLGGAIHNASSLTHGKLAKAHGCSVLFHLEFGLGYDVTDDLTVQLFHDHFSNANLCSNNQAGEHLGVRVGYRF